MIIVILCLNILDPAYLHDYVMFSQIPPHPRTKYPSDLGKREENQTNPSSQMWTKGTI